MGIQSLPAAKTPSRERTLSMDIIPTAGNALRSVYYNSTSTQYADPNYTPWRPIYSKDKIILRGYNFVKILDAHTLAVVNTYSYGTAAASNVMTTWKLDDDLVLFVSAVTSSASVVAILYRPSTNTFGTAATITTAFSGGAAFVQYDGNTQMLYITTGLFTDPSYSFNTRKHQITKSTLTINPALVGTAITPTFGMAVTATANGKVYQYNISSTTSIDEYTNLDYSFGYGVTRAATKTMAVWNSGGFLNNGSGSQYGASIGWNDITLTYYPTTVAYNHIGSDFAAVYGNYLEIYAGLIPTVYDLTTNTRVHNAMAVAVNSNTTAANPPFGNGVGDTGCVISWNGNRYYIGYQYRSPYWVNTNGATPTPPAANTYSTLYISRLTADGTIRTKMFPILNQYLTYMPKQLDMVMAYINNGRAYLNTQIFVPSDNNSQGHSYMERLEIGSLLDEVSTIL